MRTSLVVLLVMLFSPLVFAQSLDRGTAEVNADKLRVDHTNKRAFFSGNVKAVYNDLTVTCDQMELEYDDKGRVVLLIARGAVTVTRANARATANSARLDAKKNILILEGNPTVTRGPHSLRGSRIQVHLNDERLEVTDVKGSFKLGPKTKKNEKGVAP